MPIKGPNPQSAKLDPSTLFSWTNGETFTGSLRLGIVVPQYGGTANAPAVTIANQSPAHPLPMNTFFQITNGYSTDQSRAYFNTSLRPPNSQYVAWFYDSVGELIAGPSAQFTITADPFTPPSATLTTPSVGDEIPPSETS